MRRIVIYPLLLAVLLLALLWNYPISNGLTRLAIVALAAIAWLLLIAAAWRARKVRIPALAASAAIAIFLLFPSRQLPSPEILRTAYVRALRHYTGVPYIWGGECGTGIDCSGLARRAMVDALVGTGFRTLKPEAVRLGLDLWWHDSTAAGLAQGAQGQTVAVAKIPNLRTLSTSLPGDLAVSKSGIHVLIHLGDGRWIEAAPDVGKVSVSDIKSRENTWFDEPMQLARWRWLADQTPGK